MSSSTAHLRILEEDHGADAVTFEKVDEGITYLFVSPNQSFDSAVKSILRVCPELERYEAQELVRTHCRNIIEMNERLGAHQNIPRFEAAPAAGVVPPAPVKEVGAHRRPRPPRWARIAAVAAPALVGGAILAQWLNPAPRSSVPPTAAAPPVSQNDKPVNADDQVAASTYRNPDFEKIAKGGQMKCDPMGPYEAKCVDSDGKVMTSEASVGTSTAFTFSYDFEKVGFRVFPDEESASAWAAEEGNKDLYHNVRQHDRIVLWGTDDKRLTEWERSVVAEQHSQSQHRGHADPAMFSGPTGAGAPLPSRLATLAFGTLGVTEEAIQAAVRGDDAQSVQLLRAVQLVLGSAASSQLDITPAGPNDAVAVVVDATSGPQSSRVEPQVKADSTAVVSAPAPARKPTGGPAPSTYTPADTGTPTEDRGTDTDAKPKTPTMPPPEPSDPAPAPEQPESADPSGPAPVEEQPGLPVGDEPAEPVADKPEAHAEEQATPTPETPPAPPMTEEPEDHGLALEALPAAWAA
ncbi:hypothetical protein [Streptomyces rimosus]|uniref:hypothetical protein n=1 Tax=Streptomyces rimosus TaxID=1927 RepID=UPI0004C0D181|nr:hypothetical protein [Streptomyces rimosus]